MATFTQPAIMYRCFRPTKWLCAFAAATLLFAFPFGSVTKGQTLSDGNAGDPSGIQGTVLNRITRDVSGVMVALVPKDPEPHVELFRRDQSDFDGVIPGSYTVIAVQDAWGFEWLKPGVLAKYVKQGQELTIGELMRGMVRLPEPVEVQGR